MIIGRSLQISLGKNILFSTKHLKWDGTVIPMHTSHAILSFVDTQIKNIGNFQDVFATASIPTFVLDANI
jgi:hypothetical protein